MKPGPASAAPAGLDVESLRLPSVRQPLALFDHGVAAPPRSELSTLALCFATLLSSLRLPYSMGKLRRHSVGSISAANSARMRPAITVGLNAPLLKPAAVIISRYTVAHSIDNNKWPK